MIVHTSPLQKGVTGIAVLLLVSVVQNDPWPCHRNQRHSATQQHRHLPVTWNAMIWVLALVFTATRASTRAGSSSSSAVAMLAATALQQAAKGVPREAEVTHMLHARVCLTSCCEEDRRAPARKEGRHKPVWIVSRLLPLPCDNIWLWV